MSALRASRFRPFQANLLHASNACARICACLTANGVLLPRYKTTGIPILASASPHRNIYTDPYYEDCNCELFAAQDRTSGKQVRAILKSITTRLQSGQFGY